MAAPYSTEPTAPPVVDGVTYRPLAGMAVASFIVAGVYALMISVVGWVSYRKGAPLLLHPMTLLLPVTAVGLAIAARRQIRSSEGTRAGLALAAWGGWLGLLFGLLYLAITLGTGTAVSWQAQRFSDAFFELLRQGKYNEAYLLTRPPAERKTENPADFERMWMRYGMGARGELKGPLPAFIESELVRLFQQGGPETQCKALGVRQWDYKEGSYHVAASYKLATPEGVFTVLMKLQSVDSPELGGRRWQVLWTNDPPFESRKLTPLGEALEKWRYKSTTAAAQTWLTARQLGYRVDSYLQTLPADDRAKLLRKYNLLRVADAVVGPVIDGGWVSRSAAPWMTGMSVRRAALPGYDDYAAGAFVQSEDFVGPDVTRTAMVGEVKRHFLDPVGLEITLPKDLPGRPVASPAPDRMRIAQDVSMRRMVEGPQGKGELFRCDAALVFESEPGEISAENEPHWRLISMDLLRGMQLQLLRGPGGAPLPAPPGPR